MFSSSGKTGGLGARDKLAPSVERQDAATWHHWGLQKGAFQEVLPPSLQAGEAEGPGHQQDWSSVFTCPSFNNPSVYPPPSEKSLKSYNL